MTSLIADAFIFPVAQKEGDVKHFVPVCAGKPCGFIVCFRDNGIGMIDADFRTGIDAVLSFPKFNQPGSSPVIKINREGVKDHLETGRHIIIEPGVSGLLLRGVHRGGKESAVAVKTVAERICQLV